MQRITLFAAAPVAALLSLAACNQEPETVSLNGADPVPVELHPDGAARTALEDLLHACMG